MLPLVQFMKNLLNTDFFFLQNLAKELPPLTDEDYKQVYEELLTYDAAPPSPSEQLALESGRSPSTPLLGSASDTARNRIDELLERLNRRVPEGEAPLTPVKGREEEEETLLSKLTKMRQTATSESQGESGSLSSMLESTPTKETRLATSTPSTQTAQMEQNVNVPTNRPHARTRGRIFYAMCRLLQPFPGTPAERSKLIIGEQPPYTIKLDIATKQEWAALVLEAADDRSLTDVLTTFELMKVSSCWKGCISPDNDDSYTHSSYAARRSRFVGRFTGGCYSPDLQRSEACTYSFAVL